MKEIMENLVKIVEQSKGVQQTIEEEMKKYYEINKKLIEDSAEKMKKKVDETMTEIKKTADMKKIMSDMFKVISDMVGADNFKKLADLQEQYPVLKNMFDNDFMKMFIPDTGKKK